MFSKNLETFMNYKSRQALFLRIIFLLSLSTCAAMDQELSLDEVDEKALLSASLLAEIDAPEPTESKMTFEDSIQSIIAAKQVPTGVIYDSDTTVKSHESTPFNSPATAPHEDVVAVSHFALPNSAVAVSAPCPAPFYCAVYHPLRFGQEQLSSIQLLCAQLRDFLMFGFLTPQQHFQFITAISYFREPSLLSILWKELYHTLANKFNALASQHYGTDQLGFDPQNNFRQSIAFYKKSFFSGSEDCLALAEKDAEEFNPTMLSNFYNYLQEFFTTPNGKELPSYMPQEKSECAHHLPPPYQLSAEEYLLHIEALARWHPVDLMNLAHALRQFSTPRMFAELVRTINYNPTSRPALIQLAFRQSSDYCAFLANAE